MSIKVFQDKVFPRHIADLMNLMHLMIFQGTDGEEKWQTYLNLKQKEYIALGLAQYYQCQHCIKHHSKILCQLDKTDKKKRTKNINAMILFLRIDTRTLDKQEKKQWIKGWQQFAMKVAIESGDKSIPHLIGLSIGIARNDAFLIQFCGQKVKAFFNEQGIEARAAIGELETVVIFMKAAASKNRVVDKIESLFE